MLRHVLAPLVQTRTMPAMPAMPAAKPDPEPATSRSGELVVAPFRGVRFSPAAVPDLAAVTSPPYDVVDDEEARRLEALHPYNVVRLILPRNDRDGPRARYAAAAATLSTWLDEGIVVRDRDAALYVYEQDTSRTRQRGLLAAVGLIDAGAGVVLPHEEVMPGPVADRLELMRTTGANLEPILLVYDGGGAAAQLIDAAAETHPLVDATTPDGVRHRLWAITAADDLDAIAADLAPRQALIADGHHRYATYLRFRAEQHDAGAGPGPWDFGLALLVDHRSYPLELQAIARVVEGLPLDQAVATACQVFACRSSGASVDEGLRALGSADGRCPLLLTDGSTWTLISDPAPTLVTAALAGEQPVRSPPLDATVLHALLLERVWRVPDESGRIRYVHGTEAALRTAMRSEGTAVFMRPVDVSDVVAVAASGHRMPRKSTSFGPKPRTGFVLRMLDDDVVVRPS